MFRTLNTKEGKKHLGKTRKGRENKLGTMGERIKLERVIVEEMEREQDLYIWHRPMKDCSWM